MNEESLTVLHVEDNPTLVKVVRTVFASFGFHGKMISTGSVAETLALLDERARKNEPISLILVDMRLPDGTGLDVISEVKMDPYWQMVPIVALSNEISQGVIDGAYAVGANCYIPKIPDSPAPVDVMRALYSCWLEAAILPGHTRRDRLQDAMTKAVRLRARNSEFYLGLARAFGADTEEMQFWLDRSLGSGNLSNLLAFLRNMTDEQDVPSETIERLQLMQPKVRNALVIAEGRLRANPAPTAEEACRWAINLFDAVDEGLFAEVVGRLFPLAPAVMLALKAQAAAQVMALAIHTLAKTRDPELLRKAQLLLARSESLYKETEDAESKLIASQ